MGQQLDLLTPKCKLEDFDMKRYSEIVEFKTSHYSFYLPVQLGMVLAGIQDAELYREARANQFYDWYWPQKFILAFQKNLIWEVGSLQSSNYLGLGLL